MTDWQPMDTVPLDTRVLLIHHGRVRLGIIFVSYEHNQERRGWLFDGPGWTHRDIREFSHWLPIPPLPRGIHDA